MIKLEINCWLYKILKIYQEKIKKTKICVDLNFHFYKDYFNLIIVKMLKYAKLSFNLCLLLSLIIFCYVAGGSSKKRKRVYVS